MGKVVAAGVVVAGAAVLVTLVLMVNPPKPVETGAASDALVAAGALVAVDPKLELVIAD